MKDYLAARLRDVLSELEGVPDDFEPELETPADPEHGDLATNTALRLAGPLKDSPRVVAEDLAERLRDVVAPERVAAVEVAGPGFINFRFAETHLQRGLQEILDAGDGYGRTDDHAGETALVEYVSANPTGPLTVGHGRNAVLGDAIANLLAHTGYDVTREYYFNDAGRQMRVLGQSVKARYEALAATEARGETGPTKTLDGVEGESVEGESVEGESVEGESVEVPASFPEDGYQGAYVTDIARALYEAHGDALLDEEGVAPFKEKAEEMLFAEIEATLSRLGVDGGIRMDSFFNEKALYDDGRVWDTLDALRAAGYVYDDEGATWLETARLERTGKEQDTVLVKSSGEPTYRLPDIAYHIDKFERGFDRMVDVFGADHVATYPDVLSALELLGYNTEKVDVSIYQFVTLVRGGEPVKMSTRRATYVTLDDLIDEVGRAVLTAHSSGDASDARFSDEEITRAGADIVRFFFLMRSPRSHLEFDLNLAKEASDKNPVYYLQYAHTRIASILRKAEEVGFSFEETGGDGPDLSLLMHEAEQALIKELLRFPDAVRQAADAREPHRVVTYLRGVANAFTQFYAHCHIIGEERPLAVARMHLAKATQTVLRNGLVDLLGVSAPERM
jgi:arginyl-tRNA synthetase